MRSKLSTWEEAAGVYGTLITLAGTGITITGVRFRWGSSETIGWSITILAAAGMLTFVVTRVRARINQRADVLTPLEQARFELREDRCSLQDASAVNAIGAAEIGAAFPPIDWIRDRLARNPDIIRLLRSTAEPGQPIRGFIMVYPLKASATRAILNGRLQSGTELKPSDMCKSFNRAYSLYIGMACAPEGPSRGVVLAMLRRHLRSVALRGGRPAFVFGKPATAHGARLLRKFNFRPIAGNENICAISYEDLTKDL